MKNMCFVVLMLLSINMSSFASVIVSGGSENDIAGRMCRTPDGRIIAIIERNPDWGSGNFLASFSNDEGATWSMLLPVVSQSGNQSSYSVVCANDTIYLFYASDESGSYKIYSIESVDGMNWNNKAQVDLGWSTSQNVYDPIVIVEEDGSLTMSYISMSNGAYVSHCPSGGSWNIDKNQIMSGAYRARICKHPNGTYMAAYHRNISGNYDIHIRTSFDLVNWTSEEDMTTNGNSHDAYCDVSPDGIYYLYYAKNTGGVYNICRKYSVDGEGWSSEESITSDASSNTQPSLFFDNNLLHLMWTHAIDYDTNNDVYYEAYEYINVGVNKVVYNEEIKLNAFSRNRNLTVNLQGMHQNNCEITVVNTNGQVFHISNYDKDSRFVLRNIPAGMYIIRAKSTHSTKTVKKIVI